MTQQSNILVSILGTGIYQEVIYRSEDGKQAAKGKYVAKALHEIFSPDRTFIIMTEGAKKAHYEELSRAFSFEPVYIPDGKNETEIWEMFSIIANAIPPHCRLRIDVTHGFRSQPILMLAISIYLEAVKGVNVSGIVYGAWDAKDPATGIAPVIELKPFLDLIKWAYATRTFTTTGNASLITKLIKPIQEEAWKNNELFKPTQLSNYGSMLHKISQALATVRPNEVIQDALWLQENTNKCINDVENTQKAAPFKALLSIIENRFKPLAVPEGDLFTDTGMASQEKLVFFYLKAGQYQQAITLLRELMVTKICKQNSLDYINERDKAEDYLNDLALQVKEKKQEQAVINENKKKQAVLWDRITQIRNDINHAAMRKKPMPSQSLISGIDEVCMQVVDITWH